MNMHSQRRERIGRELLAVILVLALLAPGLAAKERRGNDVIVTKTDGTAVSGELLAVKGTDLIIMDGTTSAGITVNLADVKAAKVVKHSKFLKGIGMGFLIGAPIGALMGLASGKQNPGWFEYTPAEGALIGVILLGGTGMLIGGTAGALSGIDPNIRIEPPSPTRLAEVASQLRPYARDRG